MPCLYTSCDFRMRLLLLVLLLVLLFGRVELDRVLVTLMPVPLAEIWQ